MFTENTILAVEEVAQKFRNNEIIFLTESDFKLAIANTISLKIDNSDITINTESPWYDTYITKKSYYVDVTAFDKTKLQITYDPVLNRKGYKYDDEALAMELKYFRHNDDVGEIAKDFYKMTLLIQAPNNECFIVAGARTDELFERGKNFMKSQLDIYRTEYSNRVKIYLFGPKSLIEFR